jgi:hypothetical protein
MGMEPEDDTASNAAPAAAESDSMPQGVVSASEEKEEEEAEGGFSCGVTSRISGNAEFVSGGDVFVACCVRKEPRAPCLLAADGVDACSWDYDNKLIKGVVS